MTYDRGKSDSLVVPVKPPNNVAQATAEAVEGRGLAKGNPSGHDTRRAQHRESVPSGLDRIRQAAKKDGKERFTTLLHHVYDIDRLRAAYRETERNAAAGIDGETWQHYGEKLEPEFDTASNTKTVESTVIAHSCATVDKFSRVTRPEAPPRRRGGAAGEALRGS